MRPLRPVPPSIHVAPRQSVPPLSPRRRDRQRGGIAVAQDAEGDGRHVQGLQGVAEGFGASASTGTIVPRSSERFMSSHPSGSTMTISASGTARAIPDASPPPPHGMAIARGERQSARRFRGRPSLDRRRSLDRRSLERQPRPSRGEARRDFFTVFSPPVVENDLGTFRTCAFYLNCGASEGITIAAGIPRRRAAIATPRA